MQNLKKNWRVVRKITWGIWKIFTRALKISKLGLWRDPLIQSRKCMSSKITEELCVVTMRNDANLKKNWLVISNLTWKIWKILTRAVKSPKNVHFNGLLLSKVSIFWARKVQKSYLSWHWRVIQNLERIDLWFQNWHEEFDKFCPGQSKVSKSFTLMSSFWEKCIIFDLKKCRGLMFDSTKDWCKMWRKTDL